MRRHLEDVRFLTDPYLAAHASDHAARKQGLDGEKVVTHVGEAETIVSARVVVH